jgi:hypothetical protein
MLPKNVEERDRLVAGRLLLLLEYPCTMKVLADEHSIGRATLKEIKHRFLSQDEKNQAIKAARDFYASRAQDNAQFAGIIIT